MKYINELENILNEQLKWNKARIKSFARILLSLFMVRTVNLSEIAGVFASEANFGSRYKRLQRFFKLLPLNKVEIARFIFSLFFTGDKKVYLILDRTNWYYGKNQKAGSCL